MPVTDEEDGEPSRPPLEALIERLAQGSQLLVLDNCEHLVSSCKSLLVELLSHCTGLRVIATSRQPIALAEQRTYPLATLRPPDKDSGLEELRKNESMIVTPVPSQSPS